MDRSSKNTRIMKWIKQGAERNQLTSALGLQEEEMVEEEVSPDNNVVDDLEDLDMDRVSPD